MSTLSLKHYQGSHRFDAIVIGSGIGGMTVAAFLARRGKRVLVLERHYTPGGFTHVFKRRDYEWDVGIHYLGDVHDASTEPAQIFKYITDGKLAFAPMSDVYDRLIFPDRSYDLEKGWERYTANLKGWFPEAKGVIDRYVGLVQAATGASSQRYFAEKAMPDWVAKLAGGWMRKKHLAISSQTTQAVLDGLGADPRLQGVLAGQYGDHGLPPAQSSFAIHSMVVAHYQKGASYPVGGSAQIAATILPVIEGAGGTTLVRAEVTAVIAHKGRAQGVRMADGSTFEAPLVISDAGFYNTMYKLLPQPYKTQVPSMEALGLEPSVGHFCLYIGLKEDASALGLGTTNLWIYPSYDHNSSSANFMADPNADLPLTYISFPSAKDPDWARRYPGRSTIEIITVAPYAWLKQWESGRWRHRGEDYEAYKEQISQRLLEKLYQHVPQVKGKIDTYELSTPLSTQHFANYPFGELYGLAHTPARFQQRMLRARTPLKGLYLTGQDLVTCGVAGALYGGGLTTSALYLKNVIPEATAWCRKNGYL